jgi:hypothetical protein
MYSRYCRHVAPKVLSLSLSLIFSRDFQVREHKKSRSKIYFAESAYFSTGISPTISNLYEAQIKLYVCSGLGQGPVEASCEHGNEPSDSIKYWEVLE